VVLHPLAGHHPVGVVPPERERVVAPRSLVADPVDSLEERLLHHVLLSATPTTLAGGLDVCSPEATTVAELRSPAAGGEAMR
jgi:hypothetical protein